RTRSSRSRPPAGSRYGGDGDLPGGGHDSGPSGAWYGGDGDPPGGRHDDGPPSARYDGPPDGGPRRRRYDGPPDGGPPGGVADRGATAPDRPVDPAERAREICLRQLAVRPRTRAELAAALRRHGISEAVAAEVLDRYHEVG